MSARSAGTHVKILVEIRRADGSTDLESVWATREPNGYRLDNIPFYARELAWGDVVSAAPDPDGLLRYTGLVEPSGHSTVRLLFADEGDVQAVRDELRARGCGSELDLPHLVAVDVPPNVPYPAIRAYLDEKERAGVFEYEEACLGQGEAGAPSDPVT